MAGERKPTGKPPDRPVAPSEPALDEEIEETFPASDPPAFTGSTAGAPAEPDDSGVDEEVEESFPASDAPSHSGVRIGGPARRRGGSKKPGGA